MLVKDLKLGIPGSEEAYFKKLEDIVFHQQMIDKLISMRRFRNRIVHRYGDLNQSQVFEIVQLSFSDFEQFMHGIREFLKTK